MLRRVLSLILVITLSSAYGLFQKAPPAQTQTPEFRASVNRVNVLVTATDKKGRLITDLTKEEF